MTERGFYAYETADEKAEHYGPFASAEEAETVIGKLGWEAVLVVRREVDEFGTVMGVQSRWYQPGSVINGRHGMKGKPEIPVTPLSEDEIKFFAEYERDMYSGKS